MNVQTVPAQFTVDLRLTLNDPHQVEPDLVGDEQYRLWRQIRSVHGVPRVGDHVHVMRGGPYLKVEKVNWLTGFEPPQIILQTLNIYRDVDMASGVVSPKWPGFIADQLETAGWTRDLSPHALSGGGHVD